MKLNDETSQAEALLAAEGGGQHPEPYHAPEETGEPKGFRRLKYNELVNVGDYVEHETRGMELWEGPRGFQAGSFVKPIYRPSRSRATTPKASVKKRR